MLVILILLMGIMVGTITGLIPGIHINTLAILLVILSKYIRLDPTKEIILIMSVATAHLIFDLIPSTLLGVPDERTALMVLPNHRLVMKGLGLRAINKSLLTIDFIILTSFLILPLSIKMLGSLYKNLSKYTILLLVLMSILIIVNAQDKNSKFWSLIIFLLSGVLGMITLNMPFLKEPLLPMFSGLFGASLIIESLLTNTEIPPQINEKSTQIKITNGLKGFASGILTALFPAISTSQVVSVFKNKNPEDFIEKASGTSASNFTMTAIGAFAIQKYRSGVMILISREAIIDYSTLVIILITILTSAGAATGTILKLEGRITKILRRINYQKLNIFILFIMAFIVILSSGALGLFVLIVSTALGVLTQELGVRKSSCMGALMIPIVLNSL